MHFSPSLTLLSFLGEILLDLERAEEALNAFRNAGIVWLSDTYSGWRLFPGSDIDMFDFTHSYAAKVASLFAMFLLATALFDLLPELHRHILRISRPVTKTFMRTNTKSS